MKDCAPPKLQEDFWELEDLLIAADMGRIKSALMVEWVWDHCDHDLSRRAEEVWVDRINEDIDENEAVDRLYEIIKECMERAKRGDRCQ